MIKPLMIALSLTADLSTIPAARTLSYELIYTESSWQTTRVPIARLGGALPGDLTLSTSGLPEGTTITLTGAELDDNDAVLTVDVQRAAATVGVNASSMLTLSAGGNALISLSVPVIGVSVSNSGE